jgi:glyoxylase-like metal-dependent hydrolase (beta-lactamase superfamily II)
VADEPATAAELERRALADAAAAGIHRIPIPTPFLVGRVNCYLIEDDPLTLVDTGPNSGKSLDELERAIEGLGHRVEDLRLLVITHQHMDHVGLLEILHRRSGAEVAALGLLTTYLASWSASAAADDEFAMAVMRRHGVPAELATALGAVGAAFRAFGSSGAVTVPLADGDELALRDRKLRALHRPGHSPSDTIFLDEQRRITLAGDHLLAHISSNPLLARPLAGGAPPVAEPGPGLGPAIRSRSLIDYIASMRATRELDAGLVLPGHGPPVTDHVALIDERLRMHQRRARKLLRMLEPAPLTAFELANRMWGNVAVTQAFLTISEVIGHIDVLLAGGLVRELDDGDFTRFAAVPASTRAQ